jgi:hypothetical protein
MYAPASEYRRMRKCLQVKMMNVSWVSLQWINSGSVDNDYDGWVENLEQFYC